jgi:hypothetical protein
LILIKAWARAARKASVAPACRGPLRLDGNDVMLSASAPSTTAPPSESHDFSGLPTAWTETGRTFFDQMARDGATAFADLQACRTPLDLYGVGQAWLMGRSNAYLVANQRLFAGLFLPSEAITEEAEHIFRLPD